LVLPSMCDINDKNYLKATIKEFHDPTAHGGVEKMLK